MKLNSHNEWDKLQEIVVGSAARTTGTLEWNSPEPIPPSMLEQACNLAQNASPQWYIDEIMEDLESLSNILRKSGVKVHRPEVHDISKIYSTPYWSSNGKNIYNVRDLHLIVGNTVIDSPSHHISRYFETTALYPIWYKYFDEGLRWISGPKPKLAEEVIKPYFRNENDRILTEEDIKHQELTGGRLEELHKLTEDEILFEAANTVRMGKDLLYLVSCSGNYKGATWLQSILGAEYKIHVTDNLYRSSHIDSTVMCLRPGLVLLNNARVKEENCPSLFDKWDKIWFGDVAPTTEQELTFQKEIRDPIARKIEALGFKTDLVDMASPWVGMNVLSIDPETVLVDERQTKLIQTLERHKLTIVPVRMRHMYTQCGGLHCATLDTVRASKLESYFD